LFGRPSIREGINPLFLWVFIVEQKFKAKMENRQFWYIRQQEDSTCKIEQFDREQEKTPEQEQWGVYASEQEAISKRIGLIRAGKCQPQ